MDHSGIMTDHGSMEGALGNYPQNREASGTSWQPDSTPHEGLHLMRGDWMIMTHGFANLVYDKQGGSRGDDRFFFSNMAMLRASRSWGPGTLGLRAMTSLDPAMGPSGYPLLLQTGETADGRTPLIDRQHPHDLFMELAATYSIPINDDSSAFAYFGLPGEPALGPPAFIHRLSGVDIPEAPIGHHWIDSTHEAEGVATAGYTWQNIRIEGSTFRGREPDQYRWDIEAPKFDSYSARVSLNPTDDTALQVSAGHIHSPEALDPGANTNRTTASVSKNFIWDTSFVQTTFAWGRNTNRPGGRNFDAFLLETSLRIQNQHTLFERLERVDKDELFSAGDPLAGQSISVNKLSVGYIYDFMTWKRSQYGVGGLWSNYFLPSVLNAAYGKNPVSFMIWLRAKII